jgi:hypothetical protein
MALMPSSSAPFAPRRAAFNSARLCTMPDTVRVENRVAFCATSCSGLGSKEHRLIAQLTFSPH